MRLQLCLHLSMISRNIKKGNENVWLWRSLQFKTLENDRRGRGEPKFLDVATEIVAANRFLKPWEGIRGKRIELVKFIVVFY